MRGVNAALAVEAEGTNLDLGGCTPHPTRYAGHLLPQGEKGFFLHRAVIPPSITSSVPVT